MQWDDGVFYAATVAGFNQSTGKFRLLYDDGAAETVRLEADPAKRRPGDVEFRWLTPEEDAAATAAAEPPEEPPATRVLSHGFFVTPKQLDSVLPPQVNSSVFTFPKLIAPFAFNRLVVVESNGGT